MAKALPRNEIFPVFPPVLHESFNSHHTIRGMLIAALEHSDHEVRTEAAVQMCQCFFPCYAVPLAEWLLKKKLESAHLSELLVGKIFEMRECAERTMALLVLSRHPSTAVQIPLVGYLSDCMGFGRKIHRI